MATVKPNSTRYMAADSVNHEQESTEGAPSRSDSGVIVSPILGDAQDREAEYTAQEDSGKRARLTASKGLHTRITHTHNTHTPVATSALSRTASKDTHGIGRSHASDIARTEISPHVFFRDVAIGIIFPYGCKTTCRRRFQDWKVFTDHKSVCLGGPSSRTAYPCRHCVHWYESHAELLAHIKASHAFERAWCCACQAFVFYTEFEDHFARTGKCSNANIDILQSDLICAGWDEGCMTTIAAQLAAAETQARQFGGIRVQLRTSSPDDLVCKSALDRHVADWGGANQLRGLASVAEELAKRAEPVSAHEHTTPTDTEPHVEGAAAATVTPDIAPANTQQAWNGSNDMLISAADLIVPDIAEMSTDQLNEWLSHGPSLPGGYVSSLNGAANQQCDSMTPMPCSSCSKGCNTTHPGNCNMVCRTSGQFVVMRNPDASDFSYSDMGQAFRGMQEMASSLYAFIDDGDTDKLSHIHTVLKDLAKKYGGKRRQCL